MIRSENKNLFLLTAMLLYFFFIKISHTLIQRLMHPEIMFYANNTIKKVYLVKGDFFTIIFLAVLILIIVVVLKYALGNKYIPYFIFSVLFFIFNSIYLFFNLIEIKDIDRIILQLILFFIIIHLLINLKGKEQDQSLKGNKLVMIFSSIIIYELTYHILQIAIGFKVATVSIRNIALFYTIILLLFIYFVLTETKIIKKISFLLLSLIGFIRAILFFYNRILAVSLFQRNRVVNGVVNGNISGFMKGFYDYLNIMENIRWVFLYFSLILLFITLLYKFLIIDNNNIMKRFFYYSRIWKE